jgi:hypothetical protein
VRRTLAHLPRDQVVDEATFTNVLHEHIPPAGPRQQTWIRAALTTAASHAEVAFPVIALLLCLGVSFSASIQDRISGAMQLPSLADLILNRGASFASAP